MAAAALVVPAMWLKRVLMVVDPANYDRIDRTFGSFHFTWVSVSVTVAAASLVGLAAAAPARADGQGPPRVTVTVSGADAGGPVRLTATLTAAYAGDARAGAATAATVVTVRTAYPAYAAAPPKGLEHVGSVTVDVLLAVVAAVWLTLVAQVVRVRRACRAPAAAARG